MSAWCDLRHVIRRLDWRDLIGSYFQISGHGEQHVRGPAHPELGLLEQVHVPVLPLLLQLLLGVLHERHHPTTPYQGSIHPPSHVWEVCQNQDCIQVTTRNIFYSVELFLCKVWIVQKSLLKWVPKQKVAWNQALCTVCEFVLPFQTQQNNLWAGFCNH